MSEPLTVEELTKLAQERMNALGLGNVRFSIRPLPFDFLNWDIHPHSSVQLLEEERNALVTVGRELREKYYLLFNNVLSPYAA
jgi:hypothetical protein